MSWQNNGGGDRGPWGQGPKKGGGGGQPPDIDELIRKGQDKFKNAFGGGGGRGGSGTGGGRNVGIFLFALLGFWLFTCFYTVNAGEEAVVMRFGKFVKTAGPGIHFHFRPIENREIINTEEERCTPIGFTN